MMYHYATFAGIEIVHSGLQGHGIVTVYCERPDPEECFYTAQFALPGCALLTSGGFSETDLQTLEKFIWGHEADILRRAAVQMEEGHKP